MKGIDFLFDPFIQIDFLGMTTILPYFVILRSFQLKNKNHKRLIIIHLRFLLVGKMGLGPTAL